MEWVHCNSCFVQPVPQRKDLSFCLTSCGHIFCTKCQGKDFCMVCQNKCSVVSLSKQLLSDVKVYFANPVSLFEKLATELERVYMFQKNQRERLFKHRKEMVALKTQTVLGEIRTLEKEIEELERQLRSTPVHSSVRATVLGSFSNSNAPQYKSTGHHVLTPKVALPQPRPSDAHSYSSYRIANPITQSAVTQHSQSVSRLHSHSPSPRLCPQSQSQAPVQSHSQSRVHPHSQPQSYAQSQARSQTYSQQYSIHPPVTSSNIQARVMMAANGNKRNPEAQCPSSNRTNSISPMMHRMQAKRPRTATMNTTPIGPTRLCIRTPPIDGKIGVIPGSSEAALRNITSPHTSVGKEITRFSPHSAGKLQIYTPNNYGVSPSQYNLCKRRSVFPNSVTPDSQPRSQPYPRSSSPQTWKTPNMGTSSLPIINARKTH